MAPLSFQCLQQLSGIRVQHCLAGFSSSLAQPTRFQHASQLTGYDTDSNLERKTMRVIHFGRIRKPFRTAPRRADKKHVKRPAILAHIFCGK